VYRKKIRENFSLLINGRNVLSLPDKLQTKLQDGDEVILTVQVMGG
jgi:molybdopterin converting factor small subunit